MRATRLLIGTLLLTLGCGAPARPYPYYRPLLEYDDPWIAFAEPPALVEIEPGLYVVHDHYAPVYYVEGDYWCYHMGVWYRATAWDRAWQAVHFSLVPARIAQREHWSYVRYRPSEAVVNRSPTR